MAETGDNPGSGGTGDAPAGADFDTLRGSLPKELQTDPAMADITSFEDLAKSYVHGQRMIGADKIALPGENATDDERTAFYEALGRPKDAAMYEIEPPADMPEQYMPKEEHISSFREAAFAAGLNQAQVAAVYNWYVNDYLKPELATMTGNANEEYEANVKALQAEYGDALKEKSALADRALLEFGGKEVAELLNKSGLANSVPIFKMFIKLGEAMAEDKMPGMERSGSGDFAMSPAQAEAQINKRMMDDTFMKKWLNADETGHKEAVAEMDRLHSAAYK